jgi:hypothetical protein
MILALMKALSRYFSMTQPLRVCVGLLAIYAPSAVKAASCDDASSTAEGENRAWPTFCAIPSAPKSTRSPAAFKAAVVETRLAGRDLDAEAGAANFSLSDTEEFAARARMEATPPPPMTIAGAPDAAAFVNGASATKAPPVRSH